MLGILNLNCNLSKFNNNTGIKYSGDKCYKITATLLFREEQRNESRRVEHEADWSNFLLSCSSIASFPRSAAVKIKTR